MPQTRRIVPFVVIALVFLLTTVNDGAAAPASPTPGHTATSGGAGKVLETMNASGYTYLLVDSGSAQTWVAIPETAVVKGATVQYAGGMVMENFHSKTLDRTFATIVFSPGLEEATSTPDKQPATNASSGDNSFAAAVAAEKDVKPAPSGSSGGSLGAIVPFAEVKVDKVDSAIGHSIEDIFINAKELDGKTVQVRGKVMKINVQIMGRNWVHLQDGSGNPMSNTHDLVITTAETPAQGDILTFEGKLSADKDFGAGYSYAVIIEDAKIIP